MTLSNEAVEAAARAICEERCWPGAWIKANELETAAWMRDATAALTAALPLIRAQVLEEAAKVCLDQRDVYLSPQYATGQPLSSIMERMACTTCADAIRALKENHP